MKLGTQAQEYDKLEFQQLVEGCLSLNQEIENRKAEAVREIEYKQYLADEGIISYWKQNDSKKIQF